MEFAEGYIATTISATGELKPVDQVEVGTQVSGDISKIYVDFNSKVKKGQVIAELDKSKLRSALTQAEIAYRTAENDLKYKTSIFERTKKLAESHSASATDLESAEYNKRVAELALERSKNEVEQARLNLSYATIKSPIDGIILERAVDVGQTVAASMSAPTLFVIAKDLSQMDVLAAVDEADIGGIKKGERVEFSVDAFPQKEFKGVVEEVRLNPTVTSNVVTYTVVIKAENPEQKLLPGMTATCTIITEEFENALLIPVKSLKFRPRTPPENFTKKGPPPQEKSFKKDVKKREKPSRVWINEDGKMHPKKVEIGINDGVHVQILSGLNAGDSVVIAEELEGVNMPEKDGTRSPFMPGPPNRGRKR